MRNSEAKFAAVLGGIVLFWLWSRTQGGQEVIARSTDAVGSVIRDLSAPRGIRNNNPGNIERRSGTLWRGMSRDQSGDDRFAVFDAPEWGIRAVARVIEQYRKRGLVTIQHIISTWAPSTENDTQSYVRAVAAEAGLPANVPLGREDLPTLIAAIIKHENGIQPYSHDVIARGIALEQTA